MVGLWLWIGCQSSSVELSNSEYMTRLSLDLRGVRPTVEELDSAERRWSSEETVVAWRHDARFARVSAERWADAFDTRQDETLFAAADLGLSDEFAFAYSVGDEPLRIIENVIERNLPWSEILTADWTVLNQSLYEIYPATWVDVPSSGDQDWQLARYTDGRPAAGVLTSNGLWWRYDTSLNNASRKRANQLSRILLCRDYLELPVSFDSEVDLTSEAALQDAIQNHPGCVSCHATLDPLAAFLGGFFARRKSDPLEMIYYHPEREELAVSHLGVSPSWNGQTGRNLADLGSIWRDDPSFARCAVERFSTSLLGEEADEALFDELLARFQSHNNAGDLITDLVLTDDYRQKHLDGETRLKRVSETQLESMVYDITGYTLASGGYAMLRADSVGYATMVDGVAPSLPQVLLQQELAHVATRYWMLESTESPFDVSTLKDKSEKIRWLHRRILGVEPTKQEKEDIEQYIVLLEPLYPAAEIWASVATVFMQDPRFLVY